MSFCLNPVCPHPKNHTQAELCQACSSKLLLRDRYRATQVLGRGGFGTTFLAKDEALPGNPSCVIKQLRPMVTAPHVLEMARELFQREAQTLGMLGSHPQLPRLLDYFELQKEFYLVQEYVSGFTLQQEVKNSGSFNEGEVRTVLQEVLPILDYLHTQEVIHRDIKPANLIRRSFDQKLVLIDFGAVKNQINQAMIANPQEYSTLTAFAVGTPGFAPPEQMALRPVYASDIYSLGITCIYLLTGKSPKDLEYDAVTGELIWQDQVQLSDHLRSILEKMLESSVRHRYHSAKEILRVLELEPYLKNLSLGMATTDLHPDLQTSSASSNNASPANRAALAIRAQQAKSADTSGELASQPSASRRIPIKRQIPGGSSSGEQASGALSGSTEPSKKMNASGLQFLYSKGRRDFAHQDLKGLNLRKANLPEANLHQAMLQNADLRGANLFNVNFGRASLAGAVLRQCNLSKAYLSHADLEGADLRGADLRDAYLNNANLRGANLSGANLAGATLTEAQLALAHTNWLTTMPDGRRGKLW